MGPRTTGPGAHLHGEVGMVQASERLLTPREVAALFRVDPKTVARWANEGRLTTIRTLGGHRRFPEREVLCLLNGAHTDVNPGS